MRSHFSNPSRACRAGRRCILLTALLALLPILSVPARAQRANEGQVPPASVTAFNFITGSHEVPLPQVVKDIKIDVHQNAQLPLDAHFKDERGRDVTLREFFTGRRPVILQMGFFGCPMLCGLVTDNMVKSLNNLTLDAGKDFEFLYISIDPTETPELAAAKKASFVGAYKHPGAADGFHLLTGTKDQIDLVANTAGFEYAYLPGAVQKYAHPAALILCSPEGRINRYLYGVTFDPQTLRLSLVETSEGKIGTAYDGFLLTCFQYDGHQGKYALAAINLMKYGAALTVALVLIVLLRLRRRGSKERAN